MKTYLFDTVRRAVVQAGCVCVLLPRGRAAQALVNRAEAPRQMADGSLAELLAESSQGSQSSVEISSGSQTPDRLRDWDSASSSDDGEDRDQWEHRPHPVAA